MTNRPLGAAVRYIRSLTDGPSAATVADGQLLDRFASTRDEAAFAALLRRHGPMVLAVCRRVLGRYQDAEDAFQATFLLLARKAASIRKQESVGSWLHGVARRLAVKAKEHGDRQRVHERRAASMRKTETGVQAAWGDLREALDEALQRLPEHYRTALVICHLEGRTHEEAARQLGCPTATLRSRLTRGRKLLRAELIRRGLTLSAGALGAALLVSSAEAASALLLDATLKAALQFAAEKATAGAVSTSAAALANEGLKVMGIMKMKIVVMLLAALSLVGVGVGAMTQPAAKPPEEKPPAAKLAAEPPRKEETQVRLDDYGDPLPDGAVRRVGTLRFRQGGGTACPLFPCPDGKTLISGFYGGDRTICLWDLATGKLLRSFPTGYMNILYALSPDGRTLVETHQGNWEIHLWDVATGKELPRLERKEGCWPDSFAFSPDGKTLAVGNVEGSIDLWDLTTRKHSMNLKTPKETISALAFTPDGKTLVAASEKTIALWDVVSRKELRRLTRPEGIALLVVSPDGALLASGNRKGGIALWDLQSGKVIHEWPTTYHLSSLVFSPDGKSLASAEGGDDYDYDFIALRDVNGGKVRRIKARGVWEVAFSPDGKTLISGHLGGMIRLWDAVTGKENTPVVGSERISDLTLAPDGRTLAFSRDVNPRYGNPEIRLWNMAAGRDVGQLLWEKESYAESLIFAPDGKSLAAVGVEAIFIWDVAARKFLRRLEHDKKGDDYYFVAAAFTPDGKILATGESDGTVRLREPVAGRELRQLTVTETNKTAVQQNNVSGVAFAPDGRTLAAMSWTRGYGVRMRAWHYEGQEEPPRLAWETTTANMPNEAGEFEFLGGGRTDPTFLFSPDGRMLAVNRWQKTIPVWEAATGKERLLLTGHQETALCIAMAPDGRTLASASFDDTIRLWNLDTGEDLRTLRGHRGRANSLVFSADGKTLVSTGDDTTMLFWDVAEVTQRPKPKVVALSAEECKSFWTDLAGADAAKAYKAIRAFSAAPGQAASCLGERLRPARSAGKDEVDRFIADLDSDDFQIRDKAMGELDELGDVAKPALRKVVDGQPSAEVRSRVGRLLEKLATPAPELLRGLRAVEALEAVGGPEARAVLAKIAKGAANSPLTREANASLKRLGK
jgi:RNA polymerase sigma factor (sigma-70 family)